MRDPFTASEISKTVRKMKRNNIGCDEVPIELIKYALESIHQKIAT